MASALSGHDVCADGRGESWAALLPAKGAAAAVVSQCASSDSKCRVPSEQSAVITSLLGKQCIINGIGEG